MYVFLKAQRLINLLNSAFIKYIDCIVHSGIHRLPRILIKSINYIFAKKYNLTELPINY